MPLSDADAMKLAGIAAPSGLLNDAQAMALAGATPQQSSPTDPNLIPGVIPQAAQPAATPSFMDRVMGVPDAALSMARNAVSVPAAMAASGMAGINDLLAGNKPDFEGQYNAVQHRIAGEPFTQSGKSYLAKIAEALDTAKLPPVMPEVMGAPAIAAKAPGTLPVVRNGIGEALHDVAASDAIPVTPKASGIATPFTNPQKVAGALLSNNGAGTENALTALQRPKSPIAGDPGPTTAQLVGGPLIKLEKDMRADPVYGDMFEQHDAQMHQALVNHIAQFGGTDEDIKAAIDARRANAAPWNGPTGILKTAPPIDAQPVLDAIAQIEPTGLGSRPVVASGLEKIKSAILRANQEPKVPGMETSSVTVSPDVLDAIRQNANDFLRQNAPNGVVSNQESVAMGPIKDAITNAVESAFPGYRDYLAKYAADSAPINRMQIANEFKDWAGNKPSTVIDGVRTPVLTFNAVKTKFDKIRNGQDYGIDPALDQAMNDVQNRLQDSTVSSSLRTAGSDTVRNAKLSMFAKALYGENMDATPHQANMVDFLTAVPTMGLLPAANFAAAKVGAAGAARVREQMAKALLDPYQAYKMVQNHTQSSQP